MDDYATIARSHTAEGVGMPLNTIKLRPGIVTTATQLLNEGGWSLSNLIRWRTGLPEKIGGWLKLCQTAVTGVARALHAFTDLSGFNYLAIGTNSNLMIFTGGSLSYITPLAATTNPSVSFSTSSGSVSVKIADSSYSPLAGDYLNIFVPVSVGGLIIQGVYEAQTIVDSTHYTITAASPATGNVTNGGAVPAFTTTNTSAVVNVLLNNHGLAPSSVFTVQVSTTVGGLTLNGDYPVTAVIDANNFHITASATATSGATASENGGNVRIMYFISSGPVSDMVNSGYGGGAYGEGAYGIGASGSTLPARNWSLDNFGQNLVAVPTNGSLYQWVPPTSMGNVATIVPNAPTVNWAMFVSMPAAQVVLLGASVMGIQDPLLVAWCDNGDITDWTATVTNQAGTYRLSRGSRIVGGIQAQQYGLIWTDLDLWSMQYSNQPFIYSITTVAQNCGLIAQNARVLLAGNAYWTAHSGFYEYGTSVAQALQCPIFDNIFNNIDYSNVDKSFMAGNSLFNEWAFFFPSASGGTGEIDMYGKYNILEGLWDYGSLIRTCWIDENAFGTPIGVDGAGFIQQHEIGYDADGEPMTGVYVESGYVDIGDGTIFLFVDWLVPDILMTGSNPSVTITLYTTNYPGGPQSTFGPFTVNSTTQYITVRCRARQMAIKVESDSLGTFWRVGAIRYRGTKSGRIG